MGRYFRFGTTIPRRTVTPRPPGPLRVIDVDPPDVVILDMALPRLPGRDVMRELLSHESTRHIPIIVASGTDTRGLEADGARWILRKPIEAEALVALLERALKEAMG